MPPSLRCRLQKIFYARTAAWYRSMRSLSAPLQMPTQWSRPPDANSRAGQTGWIRTATRSLKIWNVSDVCTRHLPRVMKLYDCIDDTSSPSVPAILPLPVLQLQRLYSPVRLYVTVYRVVSGPGCRRDRSRPRLWVRSAGPHASLPGILDLSLSCFLARIFHTFPLWVVAAAPHTDDERQTKEPWVTSCFR